MKKIVLGVLLIGLYSSGFSQTDKEWKKKQKDMDPLEFKAKMTELDTLRNQVGKKNSEIEELRAKNEELLRHNQAQNHKIDSLKALASAKPSKSSGGTGLVSSHATTTHSNAPASTANSGVVFKVQIGAFKNKALEKYFNNTKNFSGDVDNDGTKKYTLGHFIEYWEADNFKRYLREMGVADAWIVAYKDGQRVDIKDVLEGVVK